MVLFIICLLQRQAHKMSTLKTINIIHPSGSTNNIVNDASGNITVGNNLTVTGTATVGGNAVVAVTPGTSGNVLTSNGSAWTSAAATTADGSITPAKISTGGPSWTSGGVLSFNSGFGSLATAYGCRAWVNYNLSSQTLRGSGGVSSVTYNSTGNITLNFSNTMPDVNYSVVTTGEWTSGSTSQTWGFIKNSNPPTTTTCPIQCAQSNSLNNSPWFMVAIFR
jgi:hypothetical protein